MSRKRTAKTQKQAKGGGSWLVVAGIALIVLLLLLRMIAFVAGHGRHHY